ncbi:hypothetical protein HELRODRAFT_194305 [Helobdella robusta]|uniref:Palmitoyltransferase n=1 Tax=Helobdella robusta TaxID=6412 RepID=T1FVW8_HELRO|nr:hypothetical protein HELRODRAFT_194305 [Helobdella robusta]ESN92245.1 hypothetical protein HELRODRAFT_194305 [Helobdella robusta]
MAIFQRHFKQRVHFSTLFNNCNPALKAILKQLATTTTTTTTARYPTTSHNNYSSYDFKKMNQAANIERAARPARLNFGPLCIVLMYTLLSLCFYITCRKLIFVEGADPTWVVFIFSVSVFLLVLLCVSHYKAASCNENYVSRLDFREEINRIMRRTAYDSSITIHRCLICTGFKSYRTHHCSVCKKCVYKMDHHCTWIGNCVGLYNLKYFMLLNLYTMLLSYITNALLVGKLKPIILELSKTNADITAHLYDNYIAELFLGFFNIPMTVLCFFVLGKQIFCIYYDITAYLFMTSP